MSTIYTLLCGVLMYGAGTGKMHDPTSIMVESSLGEGSGGGWRA